MGSWVLGSGFHSNPLVVFTVREKTRIQHPTMFTASNTCSASLTEAAGFPVLLCFLRPLVPGEGRRPFTHMWTLLAAHFLGRKDCGSPRDCLSCPYELEGHVGGFSPGSFPALLLAPKTTMTTSPECSFQAERPKRHALVQRTLRSQGGSPTGRPSVGDKTSVTRTAIQVSEGPPTSARIQAGGSDFSTSSAEVWGKEDKREATGWQVGEARADPPPLPTFLSRGCSAGKLDQPSPERPDQSHFLCN